MVAAAAMAGVPLLNGFLSKEMFFAETIEVHDNSLVDQALPYVVTLASMFTVAYSLRFIREVFFGPAPHDLPRMPQSQARAVITCAFRLARRIHPAIVEFLPPLRLRVRSRLLELSIELRTAICPEIELAFELRFLGK